MVMITPAMAVAVMMIAVAAKMGADADAADMDAYADQVGARGSGAEQGKRENRGYEHFHGTIFLQMDGPAVTPIDPK